MRGKVRYQKELQKTYLIAEECKKELLDHYCGQMVLRSKIKGLAECKVHLMDGQREIWYDISFLQSLEQAFAVKELVYHDLRNLILQIIQVVTEMEKYLLDAGQLCFEAEYLYWNMETEKVVFLYDFTEEKTENGLTGLGEFILERTCHEEETAVDLAYFFYECLIKESFSMKEVEQYLDEHMDKMQSQDILPDFQTGKKCSEEKKENTEADQDLYEMPYETELQEIPEKSEQNEGYEKSDRLAETGGFCIVAGILSGIILCICQRYLILENMEMYLWVGISVLSVAAGVFTFLYGIQKQNRRNKTGEEKKHKYCDSKKNRSEAEQYSDPDSEMWQLHLEEESAGQLQEGNATNNKTIYIGKALLNREYSLISVKKGEEKEYSILSYPYLIGKDRERVNLCVKEHSVSRIHARLTEGDGNIYIEDLHSTNGTYVNDLPLRPHEKMRIKRGDIILFGTAEFAFR